MSKSTSTNSPKTFRNEFSCNVSIEEIVKSVSLSFLKHTDSKIAFEVKTAVERAEGVIFG